MSIEEKSVAIYLILRCTWRFNSLRGYGAQLGPSIFYARFLFSRLFPDFFPNVFLDFFSDFFFSTFCLISRLFSRLFPPFFFKYLFCLRLLYSPGHISLFWNKAEVNQNSRSSTLFLFLFFNYFYYINIYFCACCQSYEPQVAQAQQKSLYGKSNWEFLSKNKWTLERKPLE